LAEFFGVEMRFKRYGSELATRVATHRYAWKPLHLLSRQSLAAIQNLLPNSKIDLRRFRPNMVLDLYGFPGVVPEYNLIGREFWIGGVRLRGTEATGRCSFTTLAQRELPEDRTILRALMRDFGKNFGIYCEVVAPGEVHLGDNLKMLEDIHEKVAARKPVHGANVETSPPSAGSQVPAFRIPIGAVGAFTPYSIRRISVEQIGIVAIVYEGGRFYAIDDRCPHSAASLSEGFVEGGRIVCPVHFAEFNLQTGKAFNEPQGCGNVKCYTLEQLEGELFLCPDSAKRG